MIRSTFLLQIFFKLCFNLKYFIKIVRLVLAAVSANGLSGLWAQVVFTNRWITSFLRGTKGAVLRSYVVFSKGWPLLRV